MTKRNTDLLSNKEMYVKYANVVEVARNAKIRIQHFGTTNCVQYKGYNKVDNTMKHVFEIFSATPNVKGIEKFVGILHELAHVLFQSPFEASKKLLQNNWGYDSLSDDYKFMFNVFNVLEDQRIESQMGKMYLKHKSRFDKTTKKLGKLMEIDHSYTVKNPIEILLAIRFQQGESIKDAPNYEVYEKALKDVVHTDRFGALRVLVSIKPYLDEYLKDRKQLHNDIESGKYDNTKVVGKKHGENARNEIERKMERQLFGENNREASGETDLDIPDELLNPDENIPETNQQIIDIGKDAGKHVVSEILEEVRDDGVAHKLPSRVLLVKRKSNPVQPDMKVVKGLSKLFKKLKMQSKDFIDTEGEDIDIESYVESLIRGNNLNKCRVNSKITNGISLVISIDGSSSMRGTRINTARNLVATIYEAVKDVDNVEIKANVWGSNGRGIVGMTEINSKNDVKQISIETESGQTGYSVTPTHMGLEYSARMLKGMKGNKKMIIMITDGYPNYYLNGFHLQQGNYMKMCQKSMLKAKRVTDNINCIVISEEYSYRYNPVRSLFKSNNVMRVGSMNEASEKVIKQFKKMVLSSFV